MVLVYACIYLLNINELFFHLYSYLINPNQANLNTYTPIPPFSRNNHLQPQNHYQYNITNISDTLPSVLSAPTPSTEIFQLLPTAWGSPTEYYRILGWKKGWTTLLFSGICPTEMKLAALESIRLPIIRLTLESIWFRDHSKTTNCRTQICCCRCSCIYLFAELSLSYKDNSSPHWHPNSTQSHRSLSAKGSGCSAQSRRLE